LEFEEMRRESAYTVGGNGRRYNKQNVHRSKETWFPKTHSQPGRSYITSGARLRPYSAGSFAISKLDSLPSPGFRAVIRPFDGRLIFAAHSYLVVCEVASSSSFQVAASNPGEGFHKLPASSWVPPSPHRQLGTLGLWLARSFSRPVLCSPCLPSTAHAGPLGTGRPAGLPFAAAPHRPPPGKPCWSARQTTTAVVEPMAEAGSRSVVRAGGRGCAEVVESWALGNVPGRVAVVS
jgi:hypothetical protein